MAAPPLTLDTAQMFAIADAARDRGDYHTAEALWRAIAAHATPEYRTEARFRLALMLADQRHRYADAGVLLRQILDERPNAARVRLELARIDALMGRLGEAGRQLRAAEAAGLPPAVAQAVRFYAQALDARRPFGGSVSLALAPDSNVNRATTSATLPTLIGDFTLNQDARAHSGIGIAGQGQVFARHALSARTTLVARLSASANLYRDGDFNDISLAPRLGPQFTFRRDRLTLSAGPAWRWYGMVPYTVSWGGDADWQHELGPRTQVRANLTALHVENRLNPLATGAALGVTTAVERAFTPRVGGGVQLSANRQAARDPGYATASGGIALYAWRELGGTTATVNLSWSHLRADARLDLLPSRRIDDDLSGALAVNFRQIRLGTLSPIVRVRYERNISSLVLYDFRRFSGELGVVTSF